MATKSIEKMANAELERSNAKRRTLSGIPRYLSYVLGIGITLLVFYTAFFGVFLPKIQIALVMYTLVALTFIWIPASHKATKTTLPWYDALMVVASLGCMIYTLANSERFLTRTAYASPVTSMDILAALITILLILECARRTVGLAIVVVVIAFVLYAFFGEHMPSVLRCNSFSLHKFVDLTYMTTEGIFGSLMNLCSCSIFMFVAFGTFLQETGGDKRFMDMAFSVAGRSSGGPAKVSVVSSGLMAMLSGNTVSNVVTTGTLTIPLMKKNGYTPEQAGAIEAVSSSGGQITPPVMGSVAFLIADALGTSYLYICGVSILPALLFYVTTYLFVNAAAKKQQIPPIPNDMIPPLKQAAINLLPVFIPIFALVMMLMKRYTPFMSGAVCTLLVAVCAFPFKDSRLSLKKFARALENCALGMTSIVGVMAAASIIVGIITKSGLMGKCTSIVMSMSGGHLYLVVPIIMLIAYVIGCGLPSASCYIILAALCAPVLVGLGVEPIVSHMVIFWFCQLAGLTPPVCVAAFVASGIAESNPMKTGFTALKFGSSFYFVPILFLLTPLLTGTFLERLLTFALLVGFAFFFVSCLEGYAFQKCSIIDRAFSLIASLLFAYAASSRAVPAIQLICLAGGLAYGVILFLKARRNRQQIA